MNYLVTEFCGLGNFILSLPAIQNLSGTESKNNITVVGNDKYSGLKIAKHVDQINNIINLNKIKFTKKLLFYWNVITGKYQVLIIFSNSNPEFIFLLFSYLFVREKIVQPYFFKSTSHPIVIFFLNSIVSLRKKLNKKFSVVNVHDIYEDTHEIEANNVLINHLQPNSTYQIIKKPQLEYNYNEDTLKKFKLKKNNYVVLQAISSSGNITPKNWKLEHNMMLIKKFNEAKLNLVLIGEKSEYFFGLMNEKPLLIKSFIQDFQYVKNIMGKTNINDIIDILHFSNGIICLDSGIMHLGDAIDKKLIALFGSTDAKKNDVKGKNSLIINRQLECAPCLKGWSFPGSIALNEAQAVARCKFEFKCMSSITPDEVFKKAYNFFELHSSKA